MTLAAACNADRRTAWADKDVGRVGLNTVGARLLPA